MISKKNSTTNSTVLKHATRSDDLHQILLLREHTIFVVVDHQMAFKSCFEMDAVKDAEGGVVELVCAAEKVNIPVITSLVKTNLIGSKLSRKLDQTIPRIARLNRRGVNPWDDPEFAEAVQISNRKSMLITGLSVETSVSFTALGALARGFDVFVIRDTCLGYSEQSIVTAFDRLTQAGVVSVSWRQVMLEWNQGNVEAQLLRRILKPKRSSSHVPK